MLKSLYDHFVTLYNAVLPQDPSLASEHAQRHEQEIYERTTTATYRNVIVFRLVLAATGSLIFSDRHHIHYRSQEASFADIPHSPLNRHCWGSCSSTQRVGNSDESATDPLRTRAFTPHV
jgi:hypothetical protein